jgi:hypothetical protein
MLPLFDLMMKAQNGQAVEAMSKQFGLAQEQMKEAMAALMPAFSTGLKRTATNPYDFSSLMSSAMAGNYTQYFEDMAKAFTPQGISDGNSILGQIFGSKDVSRAVAAQASQMSGIGQDIYQQMLPIVANTMVGGFFKQMAEQFQATGEAIASGKPAGVFEQWMQATGMAEKPKPQQMPNFFDNPFTQSVQAMFTGPAGGQPGAANGNNAFASNPFFQMYQSMMNPAAPPPPSAAELPANAAFSDMLNQMFDSGIEVQKSYQKSMDGIFETYLSGLKPTESK